MTTDAVDALLEALGVADSLDAACVGLLDSARTMLGADVVGLVTWDSRGRPEQIASTDIARTTPLCALPGGPVCPPGATAAEHPATGLLTVADTQEEQRWPGWSRGVAAEGYRSVQVMALPPLTHRSLALHAWATRPAAFDPEDLGHVVDVMRLGSLMIAQLERVENLAAALHSRSLIAQAQGLVMERFSLGPEEAMAYLRRLSQDQQVKIRDLARALVDANDPHIEPVDPVEPADPGAR